MKTTRTGTALLMVFLLQEKGYFTKEEETVLNNVGTRLGRVPYRPY